MIKIPRNIKNSKKYQITKKIISVLVSAGHESYIVGGAVRNILLNLTPNEYDISTSATPDEINDLFNITKLVGQSFGVTIVVEDGETFEIATFREESDYLDGRHPENVQYTKDVKKDINRRDFTVNGLLINPISDEIIDLCNGLKDLKNKQIKTIGDPNDRLSEDYLRIIRAIRFANEYDFSIDDETINAMNNNVSFLNKISIERVRDEISKILLGNNPGKGLKSLDKFGVLDLLLPEVSEMKDVKQPPDFHPEGDVFVHTCLVLDKLSELRPNNIEVVYGALLHDIGKPKTFTNTDRIRFNRHEYVGAEISDVLCKRLKFSKKQIDSIKSLVKEHMKFGNVKEMKLSTFKKFISLNNFSDHLKLHEADCKGSHGDLSLLNFTNDKIKSLENEPRIPNPLINGDDLIKIGLSPGPVFKKILSYIFDEQLEGNIKNREQALKEVEKIIKNDKNKENYSRTTR